MGYGVLMHRADSIYDDRPSEQYQFPKQYLGRASQFVGDWIVYLEPSKVRETRGYFAIAKIQRIIPDPKASDMYLAIVEPGTFLEFPEPVAFREDTNPIETGLLNDDGKISGRAQSAVRPISSRDFNNILAKGLSDKEDWPERYDDEDSDASSVSDPNEFSENEQAIFERPIIEQVINRKFRDQKFKHLIRKVYDRRCAFTGLRLINGGGRPEVEAAHIRPVSANGPDSVRNGIALSGTVHWMFDRGMLSLSNDFEIIVSRHMNHDISNLLVANRRALVPSDVRLRPHPTFLDWHRENIFKQ